MTFNFTVKEFLLGGGAGTPSLQFYKRGFNLQGNGTSPSWQDIILHGTTALTLVNAKAGSLEYLKLFGDTEQLPETYLDTVTLSGGCEQNGTPTPDTPIDIICNNGAIRVSPNLFDNGTLYNWFFTDGVVTYKDGRYAKYMRISSNETYTISRNDNYDVPLRIVQTETTPDDGVSYKIDGTSTFVSIASDQFPFTFTSRGSAKFLLFSTDSSLTEAQSIDLFNKLQVEQSSTATPYMPYGNVYTDGTQEVVTDGSGNTANAERLLAVGNYKDTQEVLTGTVSRKVGIKVLDGTENWKASSFTEGKFFISTAVADWGVPQSTATGYCTHAVFNSTSTSYNGRVNFDLNSFCFYYSTSSTTLATFKQFLTDQYANGTPVIIAYPLSSSTTESISGQLLQKSPVTQTAGSISNLPIAITESQKTVPTPQQPLQINCNNGVLGIDSQGNIAVTGTTETVEITGKNLFDKDAIGTMIPNPESSTTTRQGLVISNLSVGTYTFSCNKDIALYYARFANGHRIDSTANNITSNVNIAQIILTDGMDEIRFWCDSTTSWDKVNNPQLEQGSTATTYEPYYNGGTATAEMLLKVGTYQDVQSVIDGSVTRNVGVKVLDGSENFATNLGYFLLDGFSFSLPNNGGYCTHLKTVSSSTALGNRDDVMRFGYTGNPSTLFIKSTRFSDVSAFKQFLTQQYNAGTPVIIVYPLATATTETVTAQPMNIQAGTNIVQITQGSIDGLELEVKYKATV